MGITILPFSLPLHVSKSFSDSMGAKITSAVTGPASPGVHAFGMPMIGHGVGVRTCALKRSFTHPRPKVPQFSRRGFDAPHSRSFVTAQSAACLMFGEPVRRGP